MSKLTDSARDKPCIRCGKIGETCARHYNGFRSHSYGKGRGIKCNDICTAEFCNDCDQFFSEANYDIWDNGSKSVERSEEFLHWVAMTNIRRLSEGVLMVP